MNKKSIVGRFAAFFLFLLIMNLTDARGENGFAEPDFAYPQTVGANARRMLSEAASMPAAEAGVVRLRALLELAVADNAIDADSLFAMPELISAQAEATTRPADRAMLLTLEADVLKRIYGRSRYTYDRVDAPLLPLPDKVSLWSGAQFRMRVDELLDSALTIAESAPEQPLERYAACLDYSAGATEYVPDVRGFIRMTAVKAARSFDEAERAATLTEGGLASTAPGSAPHIYWLDSRDYRNYDALEADYEANAGVESARLLLLSMCRLGIPSVDYYVEEEDDVSFESSRNDGQDRLVAMLRASLERFPEWAGNSALIRRLEVLTVPTMTWSIPRMIAPDSALTIDASYAYARTLHFDFYRLPDGDSNLNIDELRRTMPRIASLEYRADDERGKCSLDFSPDAPGRYAVVGMVDTIRANGFEEFIVTPLVPVALSVPDRTLVITAAFADGKPVGGVTVLENTYNYRSGSESSIVAGRTDRNGLLNMHPQRNDHARQTLSFRYDGHLYRFNDELNVNAMSRHRSRPSRQARLMTDRALYHPGDSVRWAAIVGDVDGTAGHVVAGERFKVSFFDANYQEIDSVNAVTDALGRIEGSFAVPHGLLAGRFRISIGSDRDNYGSAWLTVSDFRLPTMFAEISSVLRDEPAAGNVTLQGRVRTYSGMPVAGARIDAVIKGASFFVFGGFLPSTELGRLEARTEADGTFSIVVTDSILNKKVRGESYHIFMADVTATSANAETADASRCFTTGKPLFIQARFPERVDGAAPVQVRIEAVDADSKPHDIAVRWRIGTAAKGTESLTDVLASGDAICGTPFMLDLADVPAGRYSIEILPADTTLADKYFSRGCITVYNTATNDVPRLGSPMYVPVDSYVLDGNSAKVLVGVADAQATVYAVTRSGANIVKVRTLTLARGFHEIKAEAADGSDDNQLMLVSVRDGRPQTVSVDLNRPAPEAMKVTVESFRDRLVPGDRETWRFRIVRGGTPLAGAGMAATMFNSALDALSGYSAPSPFALRSTTYPLRISVMGMWPNSSTVSGNVSYGDSYDFGFPEWKYLGEIEERVFYMTMARSYNGMMMKAEATMDLAVADDIDAPLANAAGVAETEEAAADEELAGAGGASVDEGGADSEPVMEYRDAEVLQAFFCPGLVSDADGNVDVVFNVPNANASWTFLGFAWNENLATATHRATAMSNKPVMVQPNLPRFLRQGDTARLGATVFNNTDSAATVRTTVEIFNPADGSVLRTENFTNSIEAQASAVVAVELTAATDVAAVGYRVRSVSGRFADGEQSAIPVLKSEATVVESTEFYLNPTDSAFVLDIPVSEGTAYTLQYCSNPVWTVVKAMRGIDARSCESSVELVGRIYSALAARRIATLNPAIADAYRQWQANPGDEALTSMLERNSELKTLMLDRTPWVQAAADNSMRMASLGRIFDAAQVRAALDAATETLRKRQNADGGIAWTSWSRESSEWVSRTVLMTLGLANSMDMIEDDSELVEIARSAFAYVQREATTRRDVTADSDFAMICNLWPQFEPDAAGRSLLSLSVGRLAESWRELGTVGKAAAAIVLKANGREHLAGQVLESVSQFGVTRPGQGICFPSVDDIRGYATIIQAYAEMGAPRATLDALRQWITVQAQANDDLGAYNPDYVIASVLLTGSDWTSAPLAFGLLVDGQPLESTAQERATGYTVARLHPSGHSLRVEVRPNGSTPSYGSVTSVGDRVQSTVAPHAGRDLSIGKRFLVLRAGEWVETETFSLGERVRVQLTIEAGRDMEYVAVTDLRPAAFEPVDQMPGYVYDGSLAMYRTNGDTETDLFVSFLPRGTYHVSYDMTANNAGRFTSGIATIQSQYAPELTAHSGGTTITIE